MGHDVHLVPLAQTDIEEPEEETKEGRAQSIAQASHACQYSQHHSLLLWPRVLADQSTDRGVNDAGYGREEASQPHQPGSIGIQ